MALEQWDFGAGNLYAIPLGVTAPTPVLFGTLQDISVKFAYTGKPLMGQYQAPVAIARGGLKITATAKQAKISAANFNSVFFGQTGAPVTGNLALVLNEGPLALVSHAATVAGAATWTNDLGVINASTGVQYTPVASGPAALQYSVAAGVYTFAMAETGTFYISYEKAVTGSGQRITGANQLMGSGPLFMLKLYKSYNGNASGLTLYQCISTDLSLDAKNEDWTIPEFSMQAMANLAGNVYDWSSSL
jgi:hypothetical protein